MPTSPNASGSSISNEDYKKRIELQNKKWADCSVEEKLEKVREELIQLQYNTTAIHNVSNEVQKLKEHTHADGKVVIPLNSNALNGLGYSAGLASRPNNLS